MRNTRIGTTAHPPAHEVPEAWHEDLSEQGVANDHFIRRPRFCGWALVAAGIVAWLVLAGFCAFLFGLTSVLLASGAYAHQALPTAAQPQGWSYPMSCCSLMDCRQASEGEVRETAGGYLLTTTGEVVPYMDKRVKDSPDGLFHTCQQGGNFDTGRVLCLFRPPRGM
jgi:hypothetical protein